jgi:hypothetical protein
MIKKSLVTASMLSNSHKGEGLTLTARDRKYDGVLQDADFMGSTVCGHIFGAGDRFEDGAFIETSEVVRVSQVLSVGWFVETVNRSRYLISSVNYNPTLSSSTVSVEAAAKQKQQHISINPNYFSCLSWNV